MKITEQMLFYIWKYQDFNFKSLFTDTNHEVKVFNQGVINAHAGPDFFMAHIMIGNVSWVGNVEIHVNSSDWYRHNHQNNKAYDNVILHVVYQHDGEVFRASGKQIPTIELKSRVNLEKLQKKTQFFTYPDFEFIACEKEVNKIPKKRFEKAFEQGYLIKTEEKQKEIHQSFQYLDSDFDRLFYTYLFRCFGMSVNSVPFEQLAKKTNLKIIENAKNLFVTEALLLGQSGFLEGTETSSYVSKLKTEYTFLKHKYGLSPLNQSCWKFSKLRPHNFPTVRIAQLSSLLTASPRLFIYLLEQTSLKQVEKVFLSVKASLFWDTHYVLTSKSNKQIPKRIGKVLIHNVLINAVIPVGIYYGKYKKDTSLVQKLERWIEALKPEDNKMTRKFTNLGINITSAKLSQGACFWAKEFCEKQRCMECSVGKRIILNK